MADNKMSKSNQQEEKLDEISIIQEVLENIIDNPESWSSLKETLRASNFVTSMGSLEVLCRTLKPSIEQVTHEREMNAKAAPH